MRDGAEFAEGFEAIRDKYDEVVDMDPVIGIYRDKYVEDLSRRLGINDDRLPGSYTIMTLLNPLFGLKPVIVGSKLMTETQYDHAREGVVRLIQEELDSKNPITSSGAKDGDDNSLDGEIAESDENDNRRLAEREMRRFESHKMQKYIPERKLGRKLSNVDSKGRLIEVGVGPIKKKGKTYLPERTLPTMLISKVDLMHFPSLRTMPIRFRTCSSLHSVKHQGE